MRRVPCECYNPADLRSCLWKVRKRASIFPPAPCCFVPHQGPQGAQPLALAYLPCQAAATSRSFASCVILFPPLNQGTQCAACLATRSPLSPCPAVVATPASGFTSSALFLTKVRVVPASSRAPGLALRSVCCRARSRPGIAFEAPS